MRVVSLGCDGDDDDDDDDIILHYFGPDSVVLALRRLHEKWHQN